MLDACVLDLTHKVNCYRWYVAIVSARDATWTTRIVASAMVPREDCESVSFVLGEFAHAMEVLLGHRACPSAVISDKGLLVPGAPARALADGNALAAPSGTITMLKELRPRVHPVWWPLVRQFMYWLLRDARLATAAEFDAALLGLFAHVRPRSSAQSAQTALTNWGVQLDPPPASQAVSSLGGDVDRDDGGHAGVVDRRVAEQLAPRDAPDGHPPSRRARC